MDTLSHALYGGVAVGRRSWRQYLVAFFFGAAPDLLSFGPYFFLATLGYVSFERDASGRPDPTMIPDFVYVLYDASHSLVVYAVVFALIYAWGKRRLAYLTLGWPLHILVDMPTHSREFFPTPFLWPLSDFTIQGIPWSTPWIFIPNVLLIISLYAWWWYARRKSHRATHIS